MPEHGSVRMELGFHMEGLRGACQNWFTVRQEEVQRMVDAELDRLMDEGVLAQILREETAKHIRRSLEQQVRWAVDNALWDAEAKSALGDILQDALHRKADELRG